MKLLLFSDLHCDAAAASALVKRANDFDVVIGAGDFATCRQGIEKTISVLQKIERPAVLVPGNAESVEELRDATAAWESATVLHGNGTTINGVEFFGLGAAVPETPFGDWSYDLSEDQAEAMLADCQSGGVLVSHSPPKDCVDLSSNGRHIGSTAVRACIESKQPRLVVCGHIHACWEQTAQIGETTVINTGPRGVEYEL